METLTRNEHKLSGQDPSLLEVGTTPVAEFAQNARDALIYTLVQSPLSGATQLMDKSLGTNHLPKVQFMNAPKEAEVGTPAWTGQVIGATIGTAAPFLALHRMIGPGAAAKLESTNAYGLGRQALPHLGKSMLAGGAYSAILQPVNEKEEGNFWLARGRNGVTGGLAALTLTATSIGLKSTRIGVLTNDVVAGSISGVPAGLVSANAHSLLAGKGWATSKENGQAVATFVLGGAFLGGANMVHEYVKPTTGMRGVRTLEDVVKLADSTRTADHEVRISALMAEERAGRPYFASPGKTRQYDAVMESLKDSPMPLEQKKLVANAAQDLATSFEALAKVESDYVVTMYGSARTTAEQFEYHRARYTSGLMAQKGMAVMTGGGVDVNVRKSIMDAGNRGAMEAGGESIGVSLELPFEAAANPFQSTKLIHREFFTRKEVLRKANGFIVEEGGLGSVDEAMEVLSHLQCGKAPGAPVYFIGNKTYGPVAKALENLVSRGLMSPKDLKLFKIVEDPRLAVQGLEAHRDALRATRAAQVQIGVPSPAEASPLLSAAKPAGR